MSEPQPITSAEVDQIVDWSVGVRILHVAHGIASERYARLARFTGVLVAVLTAVVGTALFISAASSASAILRNSAGALSLLAATLGVAQVALNYPELAIRHRQAFVEYGKLRRELDTIRLVARTRPVRNRGRASLIQSSLGSGRDDRARSARSAPCGRTTEHRLC